MTLRRLGYALYMPFISPFRVIVKSGVYAFESSDDLINFCHLNTVFENKLPRSKLTGYLALAC
ncbi:MAG: hypothetical protein KZQ63_00135 [Candidatus Thiodiazotropha sp. (ex Lucinoma aequizonata)]|nr:hypothetical protein [Candidatus Thiodiazotropha sp. (ex Lucinoma aequizonata)]MCU7910666.1 hypothetical protein [Candidatus Thiodiazotropha sp. (ex Lucinoma aequizonata)]